MDHPFNDDAEVPEDVRRAFERDIATFEQTRPSVPFERLEASGLELPAPETLNHEELRRHLDRAIRGLAFLGVFLHHTDHLSDRQLYERLWREALREPVVMMPGNPNFGFHLDLADVGDPDGLKIFLSYYADEETRAHWAEEHSADALPPVEKLPYDRDRALPRQASVRLQTGEAS